VDNCAIDVLHQGALVADMGYGSGEFEGSAALLVKQTASGSSNWCCSGDSF